MVSLDTTHISKYDFSLREIRDLIPFNNVFSTQDEYMSELSCLPRIEIGTPLYVLTPKMELLFTQKLRYYRLLVERGINRHINSAIELSEKENDDELTKFIWKKTKESVLSLVNEVCRQLAIFDSFDNGWANITSTKPTVSDFCKPVIEYVVFLHYLLAELVRCWMEMQDRYIHVIGETGRYDVSLLYTGLAQRMSPDAEFEVKQSEKYDEGAKDTKKTRTDCCFTYDNKEYFATAIQEFTNKLKLHHLISDDVDVKAMESLFSGRPCKKTYIWLGENHVLTHIIKKLTDEDEPIIKTWPDDTPKWKVVSQRFVDKDGNPLPNISKETLRKKQQSIIDEVVKSLASYL